MSDAPMVPPPPPPPMAPTGAGAKGKATASGVILLVLAGLVFLAIAIFFLNLHGEQLGGLEFGVLGLSFLEGGLNLLAGILILRRKRAGRILGIAICSIGIALVLVNIGSVSPLVLIGIALRALVIVLLAQSSSEFA